MKQTKKTLLLRAPLVAIGAQKLGVAPNIKKTLKMLLFYATKALSVTQPQL